MTETEQTTTLAAPRQRRDDRDRTIEHLQIANARANGDLNVPELRKLLDLPKDKFQAMARKIFEAINTALLGFETASEVRFVTCPKCGEQLEAPSREIQIANLRTWQLKHPTFFQWSERELLLLYQRLEPGDVIIPNYAYSCGIRRPSGEVVEHKR
jgi:hypothetical protein